MLKFIPKLILNLAGWHIDTALPKENKFILIGAPHTSNWDFPLSLLAFWTTGLKIKWVGKSQMFCGPFYYLFTMLGGIPVDRSATHGFIEQMASEFKKHKSIAMAIAPEGTRSKTKYWKSGFYYIALTAEVPICLGFIDYKKKTLGFNKLLYPTGKIQADIKSIADFYKNIEGKYPNKQGPIQIKVK